MFSHHCNSARFSCWWSVINLLNSLTLCKYQQNTNPQAKLEVLRRRVRLLQSLEELRQTQLQDSFATWTHEWILQVNWIICFWPFFFSSLLVTFTAHPNVNFPNLGMQDLYGLIDKPADVVWQDDRCNRKQPQQSQSPASVRSFLVKKWLFKYGDVLVQT